MNEKGVKFVDNRAFLDIVAPKTDTEKRWETTERMQRENRKSITSGAFWKRKQMLLMFEKKTASNKNINLTIFVCELLGIISFKMKEAKIII